MIEIDTSFPVVISSPSGGGKTTLKNKLIEIKPFEFSITCTTRGPRPGEKDGVDYYFISEDEFNNKIKAGEFLEWAEVHGKRYGTLKKTVDDIMLRKNIPVMTIDVVGAMNVKKIYPFALMLFIIPPDFDTMISRLKFRGDSTVDIKRRLKTALKELDKASNFDFIIINDKIDNTLSEVLDAVKVHSRRFFFKRKTIDDIKKSIEIYLKEE